ncbi:MAG: HU family DNA-binding protein [Chloroflexi bacterium]|nr:HU family DNA-binding protein [Chloroflexota bacterium]
MNKSNLVRHMAHGTRLSRSSAEAAVNSTLPGIAGSLARKEAVSLLGFGTFAARRRPARNPRTGETVSIDASTTAVFKPGKALGADLKSGAAS